MTIIDHLPGRTLELNGEKHLFFSGTAYLGMGHQSDFRAALLEGIEQYGTVFSASRNNNLQLKIYDEAEAYLAKWTSAEAALTVTSGLLAGQLVIQTLQNQRIIYAPSVHPAIWQADAPPQYQAGFFADFQDFSEKIVHLVGNTEEVVTICCNAIDPLKCMPYDFSWLTQLPDNQGINLIFDDSHGIGLTGENGGGFYNILKKNYPSLFQKDNINVVVIASLAKALGLPGGVILGSQKMIQRVRANPLFVGASPIVPAYLFAFLQSQNIYAQARATLQKNIIFLKEKLPQNAVETNFSMENGGKGEDKKDKKKDKALFRTLPNYPVFFTPQNKLAPFLLDEKILISSFSYPKPTDPPITRVIVSTLHTEGDIDFLARQIHQFNLTI